MQRTIGVSDIEAVAQQLAPLLTQGQVVELRVMEVDGRTNRTDSGYFDNLDDLARYAVSYSGRAPAVYMTVNPVHPALLARAANRMREYAKSTTSDTDILHRQWFLVDCDPVRPSDIASTDIEHEAALTRARQIADWLTSRGWPLPIFADSGNGAHLLYRTEQLPNSPEMAALFSKALQALAMTFDDDAVTIDVKVFNAARIWKCYGTMACKGDSLPERPHRKARILSAPPTLDPADITLLETLAALVPDEEDVRNRRRGATDFDLDAWIQEHGLAVRGPITWSKGGRRWVFDVCPWNPQHTNKSAYLVQFPSGAIAAGCHHNGCAGHTWANLREMYDGPRPVSRTPAQPEQRTPQINRQDFDPLAYRSEDGGVLDAWADLYSTQWRFAPGWDAWLQWKATHWQRDETLRINSLVETLLDEMNTAAKDALSDVLNDLGAMAKDDEGKDELSSEAARYKAMVAATKRTDGRIVSVEKMARHRVAVHSREFNVLNALNLQNGTLDLNTFALHPHRQSDNLTYVLPYAYDPTAQAPRWQKFLREVLVRPVLDADGNPTGKLETDDELIALYQEMWGYSLTTLTHHQILVFQVGEGGNGKSVAIRVLNALLGEQLATTLDFSKLGAQGNYDIARIPGKRVLLSTESKKGSRIPEDILKKISDGEPLTANQKYETPYEFVPVGKIWWSMNHLPRITDTTMSIWRRFKIVPFRRSFSEKDGTADIDLVDKLCAELPGILNWALLGWERLLNTGRFTQANAVDEEVSTYRAASNPVRLWLEERCRVRSQDGKPYPPTTKATDVYDDYLTWCEANGFDRDVVVNSREFAHEMQRLGYPSKRTATGMLYPVVLELPIFRGKHESAD